MQSQFPIFVLSILIMILSPFISEDVEYSPQHVALKPASNSRFSFTIEHVTPLVPKIWAPFEESPLFIAQPPGIVTESLRSPIRSQEIKAAINTIRRNGFFMVVALVLIYSQQKSSQSIINQNIILQSRQMRRILIVKKSCPSYQSRRWSGICQGILSWPFLL